MNKRLLIAALFMCISLLSGCQLAKEGTEAQVGNLVGVLITDDYIDTFDFEAYFSDNIDKLSAGGEISYDDAARYDGRIWAEIGDGAHTGAHSERIASDDYSFPGIEGMRFTYAQFKGATDTYYALTLDEGISKGKTNITDAEDEERLELSATIYAVPDVRGARPFYINPVYQTEDGRLYVTSGEGTLLTGDATSGGFTTTFKENSTTKSGDKERAYSAEISIAIEYMRRPQSVAIIEMDIQNSPITRTEYACDEVPSEFDSDAEYLIVESYFYDGTVLRELVGRDDDSISTFRCADTGICIEQTTSVIWSD